MDHAEGTQTSVDGRRSVQVVHTGSVPLSMYSPEYWQKCFPEMFPYGDGVYGIARDSSLTFREWASYLLERSELEYEVPSASDGPEMMTKDWGDFVAIIVLFSEVVGTDGARQQLRHEQNGAMLMPLGFELILFW
eukprot:Skav222436  [mRNA]  locus=scaffold1766:1431:1835:+ [translate_table: standard]